MHQQIPGRACGAGVDPNTCLPVCLDVGTNNQRLLEDLRYPGIRQKRATDAAYHSFINEFIQALYTWQGHVLLQFEDLGNHNAFRCICTALCPHDCTSMSTWLDTRRVMQGVALKTRVLHKDSTAPIRKPCTQPGIAEDCLVPRDEACMQCLRSLPGTFCTLDKLQKLLAHTPSTMHSNFAVVLQAPLELSEGVLLLQR